MDLFVQLERFCQLMNRNSEIFAIDEVGCEVYRLSKKRSSHQVRNRIGLMALVHGNEYLGLPILNQIVEDLLNGKIQTDSEIYVALGNIPAAFAGKRFIEKDLNRCFGLSDTETWEDLRARELETVMLKQCDFLLDIHQTITPSKSPFFIFQYSSQNCLKQIQRINPGIPTVLQKNPIGLGSGLSSGLSSDEFVKKSGGFGTTIELGQIGSGLELFDLGYQICSKTLVETESTAISFPLFEISEAVMARQKNSRLNVGWENFNAIASGEIIGTSDEGDIHSTHSGMILFPKYSEAKIGQELFYICRQTQFADYFTSGVSHPEGPGAVFFPHSSSEAQL